MKMQCYKKSILNLKRYPQNNCYNFYYSWKKGDVLVLRFLVLGLFVCTLQARDNPFFPSVGEQDLPYTTNESQEIEPLKRATISLPPQARVLKEVTVGYKNLDGSIEHKTITLNAAVDWHLPIFISQSYVDSVSVTTKIEKNESFKLVGNINYAKFYIKGRTFKIETTDKLLRNFMLAEPHRIVLDFQKDATLKAFIKNNPNSMFKKIRVGNHKGYYRVVLELDGAYKYKLKHTSNGLEIDLI